MNNYKEHIIEIISFTENDAYVVAGNSYDTEKGEGEVMDTSGR